MAAHSAPTDLRQRLARATIPWRVVVWIICPVAMWEASSLIVLGNTKAYASPAYAVLRQPLLGGMRSLGVVLAALLLLTVAGYNRAITSPNTFMLRMGLFGFTIWYTAWTLGIVSAWITLHHLGGIGGLAVNLAIAAFSFIACWYAPHGTREG